MSGDFGRETLTVYVPAARELDFDEIRQKKKEQGLTWYEILQLGVLALES